MGYVVRLGLSSLIAPRYALKVGVSFQRNYFSVVMNFYIRRLFDPSIRYRRSRACDWQGS